MSARASSVGRRRSTAMVRPIGTENGTSVPMRVAARRYDRQVTTAGTRADGPVRRGAVRRDELFDALVELMLAEGFSGFTLDDVAARLRCSKRTLYGLAGSKEQLVTAAVVRFFRSATGRGEAGLATRADPAERLGAH